MSEQSFVGKLFHLFGVYIGAHFPKLVSGQTWDAQYASGKWDGLVSDPVQMGHHMVVLGYVLRSRPNPRVLDVGCGQGAIHEYIKRLGMPYERFLGVDLSEEAIKQAAHRKDERTDFRAANAETFTTDEKFDAIIFNEVALYFKDPGELFLRYWSYLREGGVLIVSMYDFMPARRMWRSAQRYFDIVETVRVDAQIHKWNVRMLKKRADAPSAA